MQISPINPIGPAWERMVKVLFQPFDIRKWFALGFCAFLAQCGEGGGGSGGNPPLDTPANPSSQEMNNWFEQNLDLVILIGVGATVLIIAIIVFVLWLSSRGKFMLIDGIVKNRGAIVEPWSEYKPEANSLFRFRLLLTFAAIIVFVVLAGIPVLIALPDIRAEHFGSAATISLIIGGLFLIGYILTFAAVGFLLRFFVIPTMYLRRITCMEAWSVSWNTIVKGHGWTTLLLALMLCLLGIAAGTVAFLATCLTCCLAALPYIGSVILLPLPVFFTAYALKYLEQFGDDWRFFPPDTGGPTDGDLSDHSHSDVVASEAPPSGTSNGEPAPID